MVRQTNGVEVYKKVMAELTWEEQAMVKAWEPASTGGPRQREGKAEGK